MSARPGHPGYPRACMGPAHAREMLVAHLRACVPGVVLGSSHGRGRCVRGVSAAPMAHAGPHVPCNWICPLRGGAYCTAWGPHAAVHCWPHRDCSVGGKLTQPGCRAGCHPTTCAARAWSLPLARLPPHTSGSGHYNTSVSTSHRRSRVSGDPETKQSPLPWPQGYNTWVKGQTLAMTRIVLVVSLLLSPAYLATIHAPIHACQSHAHLLLQRPPLSLTGTMQPRRSHITLAPPGEPPPLDRGVCAHHFRRHLAGAGQPLLLRGHPAVRACWAPAAHLSEPQVH